MFDGVLMLGLEPSSAPASAEPCLLHLVSPSLTCEVRTVLLWVAVDTEGHLSSCPLWADSGRPWGGKHSALCTYPLLGSDSKWNNCNVYEMVLSALVIRDLGVGRVGRVGC